jgi:CMP-N,N'-diacetyllegionaminic acid synthase
MAVVALVPARGGSKGIPRKNLAIVGGTSLLARAIGCARESGAVGRIVVSTDDDEIAAAAEAAEAEVLRRPDDLAGDGTPMLDVVRHALAELGSVDVLVLLQPTSPLRRPEHVAEVVRLLLDSDADSVVSVVAVPHNFEPGSLVALDGDRVVPLGQSAPSRQEKPVVYARNGPAVLALRPERLGDDLYGGICRGYVMDEEASLDVDTDFDLRLADLLLTASG